MASSGCLMMIGISIPVFRVVAQVISRPTDIELSAMTTMYMVALVAVFMK